MNEIGRLFWGVCDQVRLQPVCSAIETSYIMSFYATGIHYIFLINNSKFADQAALIYRMACALN